MLGANGGVRITTWWAFTSSVNVKTLRVRYSGASGTQYMNNVESTGTPNRCITEIFNSNATNVQFGGTQINTLNASALSAASSAVDTTAATSIVITGQKATAGETLTLSGYTVEVIR